MIFFSNNDELSDLVFQSARLFILPLPKIKFYTEEV